MRFAIWPTPESWEYILELTKHCEATGWDGMYMADHFMQPTEDGSAPDGNLLECWSVLAAIAAAVPRIRLAPLVSSITFRHPAVLANIAAAVDQISGGRLLLGIGAGWQENEHKAYGIELGTIRERIDRFEEAVAVISSLLREQRTTFKGEHFTLENAPNQPAPVQEPLPLLIGASGEKRMMRIAAQYADEWNTWTKPDELTHKRGVLAKHAEDLGRDPSEIKVSTQALLFMNDDPSAVEGFRDLEETLGLPLIVGTPNDVAEMLGRYRDAGADEFIVPSFTFGDLEQSKDMCDMFLERAAAEFR